MVFDVSYTSQLAYVTITIMREASAKLCLLQQCANDVNDYVTGSVSQNGSALADSKIACFWYTYSVINCLLTICVHRYYAQPM